MKTILTTSILIFVSFGLMAQTSLTNKNNSLKVGDSFAFREIQFPDPGKAGANQIWDYSKIQYTEKSPVSSLQDASSQKLKGVSNCNVLLNENGYDYFMNSSDNQLEEMGYINKELKMSLVYSDPVVKMKYPFFYGEQFKDHFIGVAHYNERDTIDFFGDYSVVADAYGTLILPDRVIGNALRVKSIKNGLQINMCGTVDINIVRYMWYASGYRYPLLSLSIVENSYSGRTPEIKKTAFTNTEQRLEKNMPIVSNKPASKIATQDVLVTISPNPFNNKLIYNYFLADQLAVSIEIYDVSGKSCGWLVKKQIQPVGLHTGELDALKYSLKPGIYFMRFTFDKQVVISKVVKI